jgi:superoxide dismutase, Cu-Zn family
MPKKFVRVAQLAAVVVLAVAAVGTGIGPAEGGATSAQAKLTDANGAAAGTVTLISTGGKLTVTAIVRLAGSTAGFHGFHIHAVGTCDPRAVDANGNPAPFSTAGPHLGTAAGQTHSGHDGDLSSLLLNGDGTATLILQTDRVTLSEILDGDGSAIIVHAGPDNFANIPARYSANGVPGPDAATLATGDSGGRTACGVVK